MFKARTGAVFALTVAAFLAGCATPEPVPEAEAATEVEKPVKKARAKPEKIESQPLKHLLNRNLKAMPVRALNVRTKCAFRDEIGTRGKLDLLVKDAEVQRFSAEVSIAKHGICRFNMKDFKQTATLPSVQLNDSQSECRVRMWEQDKGVTVAFNGCETQCSGESFSYLWPILIDTRNGRCS